MLGLFLIGMPSSAFCTDEAYYYIQVSSCKTDRCVKESIELLQAIGLNPLVLRRPGRNGDLRYKILAGPFDTRSEAIKPQEKLIQLGFADHFLFIKKKQLEDVPLSMWFEDEERSIEEGNGIKNKASATEEDENEKVVDAFINSVKDDSLTRNTLCGTVSVSYRYSYVEIPTRIIKRHIRFNSNSGNVRDEIELTDSEKDEFHTSMHLNTLRFCYSATDSLELFIDLGAGCSSFSRQDLVSGGGVKLNLINYSKGTMKRLYLDVEALYHQGGLRDSYLSESDEPSEQDIEWRLSVLEMEIGIVKKTFSFYAGAQFFDYNENTTRKLAGGADLSLRPFIYEDELEADGCIGIFGGWSYSICPSLSLFIEGGAVDQKRLLISLDYCF